MASHNDSIGSIHFSALNLNSIVEEDSIMSIDSSKLQKIKELE